MGKPKLATSDSGPIDGYVVVTRLERKKDRRSVLETIGKRIRVSSLTPTVLRSHKSTVKSTVNPGTPLCPKSINDKRKMDLRSPGRL